MKPTTPLPPAREFAGTHDSRLLRQNLCWTLAGFGAGVVSATAYLLLGGEYLWGIPRWAAFVFYPGFAAGVQANQWGLRVGPSQVVGVLAVGLAYAALATLTRFLWFALKHCRQSAALREDSE
jgi:hypothetical protein